MPAIKRDCLGCGRHNWHNTTCLDDPQKRPVEFKPGFRPGWCPINDEDFKKEKWEKKAA